MQLEGPTAAGLMYSDTGGDGPVVVLLLHPLPTGARHHGGTSRKRLRYTGRCNLDDPVVKLVKHARYALCLLGIDSWSRVLRIVALVDGNHVRTSLNSALKFLLSTHFGEHIHAESKRQVLQRSHLFRPNVGKDHQHRISTHLDAVVNILVGRQKVLA